jgi:hypothetical protein
MKKGVVKQMEDSEMKAFLDAVIECENEELFKPKKRYREGDEYE